jgi:hypothetical protein
MLSKPTNIVRSGQFLIFVVFKRRCDEGLPVEYAYDIIPKLFWEKRLSSLQIVTLPVDYFKGGGARKEAIKTLNSLLVSFRF